MDYIKIGMFLARLRKEKGLTQTNLADILNVTHQAISRWETGESIPDIQTLLNLSKFYNITVDEILNAEIIEKKREEVMIQKSETTVNYELTKDKVKKMHIISLFLAILSLVFFYIITWVSYYELVGFLIQIVFLVSSSIVFLFGYHDLKSSILNHKHDDQLYHQGLQYLKRQFMIGATVLITAITLAIPYLIFDEAYYTKSILKLNYYLSIVPYFFIIGLFIALFALSYIERYFKQNYEVEKIFSYNRLNKTTVILLMLYFPIIIWFVLFAQFLNGNVKLVLLLLMSLLFINEIYHLMKRKTFVVLRILMLVLASLFIVYDVFMPTTGDLVYYLAPTSVILSIISLFISLYYFFQSVKKYKDYSINIKMNLLSQFIPIIMFFIALLSIYLTLKYHHGLNHIENGIITQGEHDFEVNNHFSYYYLFFYVVIDFICRIIYHKTKTLHTKK